MAATIHDPWGLSLDPNANNPIATQIGAGVKDVRQHGDLGEPLPTNFGGVGGGGYSPMPTVDGSGRAVDFAGNAKALEDFYKPLPNMTPQVRGPLGHNEVVTAQPVGPLEARPTMPDIQVKGPMSPDYSGLKGGRKYWQNPDGSFTDKGTIDLPTMPAGADPAQQPADQPAQQTKLPTTQDTTFGGPKATTGPAGSVPAPSGSVSMTDQQGQQTVIQDDPNDPRNFGSMPTKQPEIGADLPLVRKMAVQKAVSDNELAIKQQADRVANIEAARKGVVSDIATKQSELDSMSWREVGEAEKFVEDYEFETQFSTNVDPQKAKLAEGMKQKLAQRAQLEAGIKQGKQQLEGFNRDREMAISMPTINSGDVETVMRGQFAKEDAEKAEGPSESSRITALENRRQALTNKLKTAKGDDKAAIESELGKLEDQIIEVTGGMPTLPEKKTDAKDEGPGFWSKAGDKIADMHGRTGFMGLFGGGEPGASESTRQAAMRGSGRTVSGKDVVSDEQDTAPRKAKIPKEYVGEFDAEVQKLVAAGVSQSQAEDIVLKKGGL